MSWVVFLSFLVVVVVVGGEEISNLINFSSYNARFLCHLKYFFHPLTVCQMSNLFLEVLNFFFLISFSLFYSSIWQNFKFIDAFTKSNVDDIKYSFIAFTRFTSFIIILCIFVWYITINLFFCKLQFLYNFIKVGRLWNSSTIIFQSLCADFTVWSFTFRLVTFISQFW
jgi:hypothetical protein